MDVLLVRLGAEVYLDEFPAGGVLVWWGEGAGLLPLLLLLLSF